MGPVKFLRFFLESFRNLASFHHADNTADRRARLMVTTDLARDMRVESAHVSADESQAAAEDASKEPARCGTDDA